MRNSYLKWILFAFIIWTNSLFFTNCTSFVGPSDIVAADVASPPSSGAIVDDVPIDDPGSASVGSLEIQSIFLFAGPLGGAGNVDGAGTAARFDQPYGQAIDASGNIYVVDNGNKQIRKISSDGIVSTFAGGTRTVGTADGVGTNARFDSPVDIAIDSNGNLYVTDSTCIRKITPAAEVTTFAGAFLVSGSADGTLGSARFFGLLGIAIDSSDNIFVADANNRTIRKISSDGLVTTLAGSVGIQGAADGTGSAALFTDPNEIAIDSTGQLFVTDYSNHTIRKITQAGVVTTFAGSAANEGDADGLGANARFRSPAGIVADSDDILYVSDFDGGTIRKITSDGAVTTLASGFAFPSSLSIDSSGNIFVSDGNNAIHKISSSGSVSAFAGLSGAAGSANGPALSSKFNNPGGMTADSAGVIYVADTDNHVIRKIDLDGTVSTLAGTPGVSGLVNGAGANARFKSPVGIVVDSNGNIFVADSRNSVIRKVTPDGDVSTWAGNGSAAFADGQGASAQFNRPVAMAIDNLDNLYVGDTSNYVVRKITPTGNVTTIAGSPQNPGNENGTGVDAKFNLIRGIAFSESANLLYASDASGTIRQITLEGVVTTIASGFKQQTGITTDQFGNIYVAETGNSIIRKVTPDGTVTVLIGTAGSRGLVMGPLPGSILNPKGIIVNNGNLLFTSENSIVSTSP